MFNHCLFLNGSGKTTGFDVQPHAVTRLVGSNPTSCSYTAGMRVKGGAPGGKTTYSLFPGYEEQIVGSTTTRRTTDSLAGYGRYPAHTSGRGQHRPLLPAQRPPPPAAPA